MPRVPLARASARRRQFFTVVATTLTAPRPIAAAEPSVPRTEGIANEPTTTPDAPADPR